MPKKPTIQFLLSKEQQQADYPEIRELAGGVLNPGHDFVADPEGTRCKHCGKYPTQSIEPCIPDTRPMEVIAAALVEKLVRRTDEWTEEGFCDCIVRAIEDMSGSTLGWQQLAWWLSRTSAEQAACALVALVLAVVEDRT